MSTINQEPSERSPVVFTSDICYGIAQGLPLFLDMLRPSSVPQATFPVIIYIRGGGMARRG